MKKMVNEEIVLNTIRKMQEAGLSESIIRSTLSDLGLSGEQVQSFLTRAGVSKPDAGVRIPAAPTNTAAAYTQPPAQLSEFDHDAIASRTSERLHQQMSQRESVIQDQHALRDSITHLALEQHGEQLKDTHQAVTELHDKLDGMNVDTITSRINSMNTRVENMSKDITDMKALMGALQQLMQKILETNQKMVFESKGKK